MNFRKRSKYGNIKTRGVDSKLELKRKQELMLLENSGAIANLEIQKKFIIFKGFNTEQHQRYEYGDSKLTNRGNLTRKKTVFTDKKHKVQDITYIADFYYFDTKINKYIIEDTKGFKTPDFKIKEKMLLKLIEDKKDHIFFCNDFCFSKKVPSVD